MGSEEPVLKLRLQCSWGVSVFFFQAEFDSRESMRDVFKVQFSEP